MKICLITGSAGLIGSEAVDFFASKFDLVVGIDNDMRSYFFGSEASTDWNVARLTEEYPNYKHYNIDIRNQEELKKVFEEYAKDIALIVPPRSHRTIGRQMSRSLILRSMLTEL